MTAFSNLKKSKQTNKINVSLLIALIAIAVSVFTGCGGDSGSNNNKSPQPTPQPTPTYSVSFITSGGSAVTARSVQQGGVISTSPETTREGFVFDGWFTDNTTFTNKVSFPYTPTGNITLYAKWTQVAGTYTVTFETNSGTYLATLNNVSSIETEPHTTRAGFDFDGWFAASDFSGGKITFPYTVTQNITLYAKWTAVVTWIEIWTSDEMNDVRNNLAGDYRIMADISLSSYSNWVPIGTEAAPFTGKINGNGYKITGLRVYDTSATYAGLFGNVRSAEITRLALENVDVTGKDYAGAIAGYMEGGSITDSFSTGRVDSMSSTSNPHSGGIVGRANTTITDCFSTATVNSSRSEGASQASSFSGGIAGRIDGGTITGNYSTGDVFASKVPSAPSGYSYSGGIAGYVGENVEIADSYSVGGIVSTSYFSHSGGIAGYLGKNSTVTDSYSEGFITSSGYTGRSGGIAGVVDGGGRITGSYSLGDITSSGYSGGIAGRLTGGIISVSYSKGYITGSGYSGGIAGDVTGGGRITNSYSTGNVSSSGRSGGIAGEVNASTITESYSTGDITSTDATNVYSGGIAGAVNAGTIRNCAAINRTIKASRNSAFPTQGNAGRIAGYITGAVSISNNFALSTMAATGAAFNTSDTRYHGVSKTDAELKQQSTYSDTTSGDGLGGLGWSFGSNETNPWKMPSGGGYPILYWQ